jgi:hypothetical protein
MFVVAEREEIILGEVEGGRYGCIFAVSGIVLYG